MAPQVPEAMRQSFLDAIESGNIRSMQNKLMPAAPLHRPGALLLGDAFNMRHPLTGAGLTSKDCRKISFCLSIVKIEALLNTVCFIACRPQMLKR